MPLKESNMGFSNVCVCCICLLGFDRQAWQKGSDRAVMNYRLVYGWFSRVFFFWGGGGRAPRVPSIIPSKFLSGADGLKA